MRQNHFEYIYKRSLMYNNYVGDNNIRQSKREREKERES